MVFSKLYAISEELRVRIQSCTTRRNQGWEAFGNKVHQLRQLLGVEMRMPNVQIDMFGHKAQAGKNLRSKDFHASGQKQSAIPQRKLFDFVLNSNLRIRGTSSNILLVNQAIAARSIVGRLTQKLIGIYRRRMPGIPIINQ